MSLHLTAGQHAWLEAELQSLQKRLSRRLNQQLEGGSRVEHAHEVLAEDEDSITRHAGDREVDLALTDQELLELGEVNRALERLKTGHYGRCTDCGCDIPYDRLKVEPQAERCMPCAQAREGNAERS
jgi:DnaK suppressor protein